MQHVATHCLTMPYRAILYFIFCSLYFVLCIFFCNLDFGFCNLYFVICVLYVVFCIWYRGTQRLQWQRGEVGSLQPWNSDSATVCIWSINSSQFPAFQLLLACHHHHLHLYFCKLTYCLTCRANSHGFPTDLCKTQTEARCHWGTTTGCDACSILRGFRWLIPNTGLDV